MKKLLIGVMILVVLFSALPTTVLAATKPVLVVTPPDEGYQGDTFVFTVMVTGLPKAKVTKVSYQIQIFKEAVDNAWIATQNGQGVKFEDLGDSYLITWNKAVKKYKNDTFAAFEVGIKLSSVNSGLKTLLQTTDRNKVIVSLVNIKPAVILWKASSPLYVPVNTKFELVLIGQNNSGIPIPFDISTQVNLMCSDRSVFPSEYPVSAYDGAWNSVRYLQKWSAVLPPHTTYTWKFQLGSGRISCIDDIFVLSNNFDGTRILSQKLVVQ